MARSVSQGACYAVAVTRPIAMISEDRGFVKVGLDAASWGRLVGSAAISAELCLETRRGFLHSPRVGANGMCAIEISDSESEDPGVIKRCDESACALALDKGIWGDIGVEVEKSTAAYLNYGCTNAS
ncbi:3481_t:CDS:2 [Acaulospora morrowiae]|uniref:3481_t:CDS:1 n=1 Tax=Acaulospora morrowiae TaxID=94023 RepID=A0A9N9ISD9_9GLOM|nr:3481_t:CDS:2 [Acaulospora morrowiae]